VQNLAALDERADELQRQGRTVMFVAVDHNSPVWSPFPIRSRTRLRKRCKACMTCGLRIIMLTGDNEKDGQDRGREVGD
jgi:cation transport ATPase